MEWKDDTQTKHRLIVLLPDSLAGSQALAHRIYWMARQYQYDVFYLALVENEDTQLQVSRFMAATAAQTTDDRIRVGWDVVGTDRWMGKLDQLSRTGDVIVCQEEHLVKSGLLRSKPIGEFLRNREKKQVVTLSGFYQTSQPREKWWQNSLFSWLGGLFILLFFTLLEVQVDLTMAGTSRKMMMLLLISIEAGAFFAWNTILSH